MVVEVKPTVRRTSSVSKTVQQDHQGLPFIIPLLIQDGIAQQRTQPVASHHNNHAFGTSHARSQARVAVPCVHRVRRYHEQPPVTVTGEPQPRHSLLDFPLAWPVPGSCACENREHAGRSNGGRLCRSCRQQGAPTLSAVCVCTMLVHAQVHTTSPAAACYDERPEIGRSRLRCGDHALVTS